MINDPNDDNDSFDDFDTQIQSDEMIPEYVEDPEYLDLESNLYGADTEGFYDDDFPF